MDAPLLCKVDAATVPVPDLDSGLEFYVGELRHRLLWRNDGIGQAAVALRDSDTEIVLTTRQGYEPDALPDAPCGVCRGGQGLPPAVAGTAGHDERRAPREHGSGAGRR